MHIQTDRLILRNARPADATAYHKLWNTPSVQKFNVMNPPTLERAMEAVERDSGSARVLYIQLKDGAQMIGQIQFDDDELRYDTGSCNVSYSLMEEYAGNGYMTEALAAAIGYAFDTLGVQMVASRVFRENAKSHRVLEKLGFVKEGVLRRAVKGLDGTVFDDVVYSMTRQDYEAQRAD